ncbi:hypothetical protein FQG22_25355 [Escherichia coli]|uniref:Uncharacterized protein n=1 Tax=Escherichia coli TaxID=562 RepID=A0A8S7RYR2_ECOLX|nr:hypothetical protein DDV95_04650 [Escherichia coli]EFN6836313.1 hypothetical protein [Escherichia coli H4]EGO8474536.1 hypothetical protein [Escherichia coli O143:H4]EEV9912792.1 hypothetical protein [Escherichia coli]EEW1566339.1 hypothetical protein [Escherichia coli]
MNLPVSTPRCLTVTVKHRGVDNNMLIDLMAAMSHKDWLSRRQRQKQGVE